MSSTEGQEEAGPTAEELLMFSRQSQKEGRVQQAVWRPLMVASDCKPDAAFC